LFSSIGQEEWPIEISQFLVWNLKHHLSSELGGLRSRISKSSHGQTRLGRHNRWQRKKHHNTISTKAQRSSPRGQGTSRNPNFVYFALIFWYLFLILYHLNRKHTNFQLNQAEGVAYRNSTFFWLKFEAPSRLWVRCLRSQIWASTCGKTRLGRHNRSQRKKNTTQSARNFNGACHGVMALVEIQILHFCSYFLDIFLISYYLNRKHTNFHIN
jgi:hypothetical protein